MFVVDMSSGFVKMDNLASSMPLRERFEEVFSEPFVRSTYMDQRRRWIKASEEQREVGIVARHTAAGLWSAFARGVPLR
jgi:hypothetical protein